MKTFRLPSVLVEFIQAESARCGLDTTAFVTRVLDGYRTDYGLPAAARAVLDEDRRVLGLEPQEYILQVLYQRQLDVRDKGAGFDSPVARIAPRSGEGSR